MLIIKLYDNGKLYDTFKSQYISIADLKHLYNHVNFQVIHNKSKEDCTRLVIDLITYKDALDASKAKNSLIRLMNGKTGNAVTYDFPFTFNDIPF